MPQVKFEKECGTLVIMDTDPQVKFEIHVVIKSIPKPARTGSILYNVHGDLFHACAISMAPIAVCCTCVDLTVHTVAWLCTIVARYALIFADRGLYHRLHRHCQMMPKQSA